MKIGKWDYTPPQKIGWNKHYESLVKKIEDKATREFRKTLFTQAFMEINLNASILSGLSPTHKHYDQIQPMYKKRLNNAIKTVRLNEQYLLSLKPPL